MQTPLGKSFEVVSELSDQDRFAVLSWLELEGEPLYRKPRNMSDTHFRFNLCQEVFMAGMGYKKGLLEGIDHKYIPEEFYKLLRTKYKSSEDGFQKEHNYLDKFIEQNSIASKLFLQGIDFYIELEKEYRDNNLI